MLNVSSRIPFGNNNPYRTVRPITSKIIFLSFEGSVTEEEYFKHITTNLFSEVKTKIQFISVAEDAVQTQKKIRTPEQVKLLSKVRPIQLVDRIEQFKTDKEDIYQFSKYPDDEFWIVTDVDKNWSDEIINAVDNKTYKDEWNDAIIKCTNNGYGYAVSNPFFELWLLLHHAIPDDDDKIYAVTDTRVYQPTNHFREKLRALGAPLKDRKHIDASNYTVENVKKAVYEAKKIHEDRNDLEPKYLATTVYLLIEKIIEMLPDDNACQQCT